MFKQVFVAAVVLTSSAASAQLSPAQKFDGALTVTSVQGASCALFGIRPDFRAPAVFRARTARHPNIPEAVSVNIGRGALIFVADDKGTARDDGTLRGTGQRASGSYIYDASRGLLPQATLNLTVTPVNITEDTPRVVIRGSAQNFGAPNCRVTVSGAFSNRDQ